MAGPPEPSPPALVGRDRELGIIRGLLERSAAEEAQTLVVSGDAGVGKTSLVAQACSERTGTMTIFGACLPLTSMSIPLLPIRTALRNLDESLEEAGIVDLDGDERDIAVRFDDWLGRRCRVHPVVLVVDDVQWADRSTLDALMYVIAGPARRHLTVIATIRAGEVGLGHPLQRWLADIRRLPRVFELGVEALDRTGTAAQIEALIGGVPHHSLIDDVHGHARGNPYFTRLMVSGLAPDARAAPAAFPVDLSSAVLQAWFRLSPETQRLATVLAVGGAAMSAGDLAEVVMDSDVDGIRSALAEAVGSGTLDGLVDGSFWFHHPMSAEVLAAALSDDERSEWHRRFADLLEARIGDPAVAASVIAVADHRYRSGETRAAFEWAIRAADAVEAADGRAEQLRLLRRAVELLPGVPDIAEPDLLLDTLLRRQRSVAAAAGATFDELEAVEDLLARLDPVADPLTAAELMVRRMHLRFMAGRSFIGVAEMREAVRCASVSPASPEFALGLAELAHAELWAEIPDAAVHAHDAITVARDANDPRALAHALAAGSMAALYAGDGPLARKLGEQAVMASLEAHDWFAYVHAILWEANAMETWASGWFADRMRTRRIELAARGGPQAYIAWLSANEAVSLLAVGRAMECEERLRVALGSDAGPLGDVLARLTAARFAALRGRLGDAKGHLLRADELFVDGSAFLAFEFDAVRAEVRLATGDPQGAYEAALAGANGTGSPPTMCEWLVPLAARALADLAQAARDSGGDASVPLVELDELVARFPGTIRDVGVITPLMEREYAAFDAMYAAEQARARGSDDRAVTWTASVEAFGAAGLPWEEAYSRWRAAEAMLTHPRGRQGGAEMLRSALALARRLGARPVEEELVDLARRARVAIEEPMSTASADLGLPGLTAREREILDLIAVGRTYGEIARSLVISEKTVSTHVSHLLAKTGSANRVELARLVHRLAGDLDTTD